ncbi:hypothetical protein BV22DRAFT_1072325 [Leucogyrophana mollusca]|uniref:Uncharacterized protein n=1 Tax=Leucogyrophana mollusca TaxID=85980 RepID=A0ACB8B8C3_9AGAM|nr:hypothetical protein BV22DRAFT_1072325 [Leucogyrophana mollusca]
MFSPENVPLDVLQPILDHLSDRRDLNASALVSRNFNRAATPLLYRTLDSRILKNNVLVHPSATLLKRPQLAHYVRHVTETGAVQRLRQYNPALTHDVTAALRLCTNLESATWIDDTETPEANFLPVLQVLRTLPLRALTIRTQYDVGEAAWEILNGITGLRYLSVWSLEWGPPRVLQGWAETLGSTLTHLELGRCAGVPATLLISVFMSLPHLLDLRLKGAPSPAIPAILACLPALVALDTEYLGSGNYRPPLTPLPRLSRLTIRTSSVDVQGPQRLWSWTRALVPHQATLRSFCLNAFSVQGQTAISRPFLVDIVRAHGETMREWAVGTTQMTLESIAYLCKECPELETLVCSVASPSVAMIAEATAHAQNLRTLKLHVQWIPDADIPSQYDDVPAPFDIGTSVYTDLSHLSTIEGNNAMYFTAEHARTLMLRNGSRLRAIALGGDRYIVSARLTMVLR